MIKNSEIKKPFFMVNTKSYLRKEDVIKIAKEADNLAKKYEITLFMIAPHTYLDEINRVTENIILTAQHVDGIEMGRGMGSISPESLYDVGVRAAYMNHAERPMTLSQLVNAIKRTKEVGILSVVCSDSIEEARAIATLGPDIILCEETKNIETGVVSDFDYMKRAIKAVKEVDDSILVELGAGIKNGDDVFDTIMSGADGTGSASAISCAKCPTEVMEDMIQGLIKAKSKLKE